MKRIMVLFLAFLIAISQIACSSSNQPNGSSDIQQAGSDNSASNTSQESSLDDKESSDTKENVEIPVDENLLEVEISLPASFFQDMTAEEIQEAAAENGYGQCVIHDDGSVTYTMSQAKQNEILAEFKNSIDESIQGMLEGEDAVESFQKIEYNDDISEVNVYVDKEKYIQFDAFSCLVFYFGGIYYQIFSGADPDTIDVTIHFIDAATNETFNTISYRDWVESNKEASSSDSSAT